MKAPVLLIALIVICAPMQTFMLLDSEDTPDSIDTVIRGKGESGTIRTDVTVQNMFDAGYEIGDRVNVTIRGVAYLTTFVREATGLGSLDGFVSTPAQTGGTQVAIGMFDVDIWTVTGAQVGDAVTLAYAGVNSDFFKMSKYIQGEKKEYDGETDPEVFCNFRVLEGPGLKEGEFLRSQTPWRAGLDRTEMLQDIYREAGVNYIISLGDDPDKADNCRGNYGDSFYPVMLYDHGRAYMKNIMPRFVENPEDVRQSMNAIADSEGVTCINCLLGKDRTGMICAMLLALTGSGYDEIKEEYMVTYMNLYGVEKDSEEYKVIGRIIFDRVFYMMENPEILEQGCNFDWSVMDGHVFDLRTITYDFLTEQAGMTDDEMQHLMDRISK